MAGAYRAFESGSAFLLARRQARGGRQAVDLAFDSKEPVDALTASKAIGGGSAAHFSRAGIGRDVRQHRKRVDRADCQALQPGVAWSAPRIVAKGQKDDMARVPKAFEAIRSSYGAIQRPSAPDRHS